jgi:membrane protein YdbS with pleckstrin-like domain
VRPDIIDGMKKEPLPSATTKAIVAVAISAIIQLTLLFYSASHPSASALVTVSLMFVIVFYPAVFEYHAHKMKTSRRRTSESPLDSN